jgi:hypothetical protein
MKHRSTRAVAIVIAGVFSLALTAVSQEKNPNPMSPSVVADGERIIGLNFSEAKRDSMLGNLFDHLKDYEKIRSVALANSVPPAVLFNPIPAGFRFEKSKRAFKMSLPGKVVLPKNIEDLAFYSVGQLAELIRNRKVTSEQLTRMYLERLKKYGPKLHCVITLTEDLALQEAKRADAEIAKGKC